jgi:hypothetical protein
MSSSTPRLDDACPDRGLEWAGRADVAQLARASPCHGEGRGFESLHPLSAKSLQISSFRPSGRMASSLSDRRGYHPWVPNTTRRGLLEPFVNVGPTRDFLSILDGGNEAWRV